MCWRGIFSRILVERIQEVIVSKTMDALFVKQGLHYTLAATVPKSESEPKYFIFLNKLTKSRKDFKPKGLFINV